MNNSIQLTNYNNINSFESQRDLEKAQTIFYVCGAVACALITIGLLSHYQILNGLNKISRWTFVALGSSIALFLIIDPTKNPYVPKKERSRLWLVKEAFFSFVTALFYLILSGITKPFHCSKRLYHNACFNAQIGGGYWVNARFFKGRVLLQTSNLLHPNNINVIETIPEKALEAQRFPVTSYISWENQASKPQSDWHSNGLCSGNSQIFIANFQAKLKELDNQLQAAISTTQLFVNGAPEEAALMQYLQRIAKIDEKFFNSSSMGEEYPSWARRALLSTAKTHWGHFKLGAKQVLLEGSVNVSQALFSKDHLNGLKEGSFEVVLEDSKTGLGHSLVFIKSNKESYIFDANIGLIPVEGTHEEYFNKILEAYRGAPFLGFNPTQVTFLKIVY